MRCNGTIAYTANYTAIYGAVSHLNNGVYGQYMQSTCKAIDGRAVLIAVVALGASPEGPCCRLFLPFGASEAGIGVKVALAVGSEPNRCRSFPPFGALRGRIRPGR